MKVNIQCFVNKINLLRVYRRFNRAHRRYLIIQKQQN